MDETQGTRRAKGRTGPGRDPAGRGQRNDKGDTAEGATRRKTEALGAGLSGTEKGSTGGADTGRNNGKTRDKDEPAERSSNKNKVKEGDRGYKGPVNTKERENPNRTKAKHQAKNGARNKHDESPRGRLNKNLHQVEDRNHTRRTVEKHQAKMGDNNDPDHADEETKAKHQEDDGKGKNKDHDTKGNDNRRYYLLVDPRPGEAPDNDYSTSVQSTGTGRSTVHITHFIPST